MSSKTSFLAQGGQHLINPRRKLQTLAYLQLFLVQKYTMTYLTGNKYKFAQIVQETAAKYML